MSTIVVLDDRKTSRAILTRLASTVEEGVNVVTFEEPWSALEWAKENTPDLVVTDYLMPEMDGADFIRRFRALPDCRDIPIIVVTAYEDPEFRYRALRMGATDFLLSPVDHNEFRVRSQNLLMLRKHQRIVEERAQALQRTLATKDQHYRQVMRESREQLMMFIDAVPTLISITDSEGRYAYLNSYYEVMIGRPAAEVVGRSVAEVMGPEYATHALEMDRQVLATGIPVANFEESFRDRDGNERVVLTTKSPLRNGEGEIATIITVSVDITVRKRAEEALAQAKEVAETASRAKTEFMANVSHELRTPLNAIVGFSELMTKGMFGPIENEKYRDYVAAIHDSGTHLLSLMNEMLSMSVADIGRLALREEVIDTRQAISACVRMIRRRAVEAEVRLSIDVPANLRWLHVDGAKLRQIVINLLSNAIKFTPAGGQVSLTAEIDEAGEFVLTIRDTGIGIAPQHLEMVLTPFGRVESPLSGKHGGTGLGLPLSKRLAELHNGTLEIASVEGSGTSVTVTFPAARVAEEGRFPGFHPKPASSAVET